MQFLARKSLQNQYSDPKWWMLSSLEFRNKLFFPRRRHIKAEFPTDFLEVFQLEWIDIDSHSGLLFRLSLPTQGQKLS